MTWQLALVLLFGLLSVLMMIGVPVAFAFIAVNIVGAILFLGGDAGLMQLARNAVASITNFSLTPIPFFVLMGEVLFHTGVAMKAIEAIELLIRRVPGRLAVVAVVAGTIFSAISGSTCTERSARSTSGRRAGAGSTRSPSTSSLRRWPGRGSAPGGCSPSRTGSGARWAPGTRSARSSRRRTG